MRSKSRKNTALAWVRIRYLETINPNESVGMAVGDRVRICGRRVAEGGRAACGEVAAG